MKKILTKKVYNFITTYYILYTATSTVLIGLDENVGCLATNETEGIIYHIK